VTLVDLPARDESRHRLRAVFADRDVRDVKTDAGRTPPRSIRGQTVWPVVSLPICWIGDVAEVGDALLSADAFSCLRRRLLFAHGVSLTPNLPEAAVLLNVPGPQPRSRCCQQAKPWSASARARFCWKGGHADGAKCVDLLVTNSTVLRLTGARQVTNQPRHRLHASAPLPQGLAQGMDLAGAVKPRPCYLQGAIAARHGLHVGRWTRDVHHFITSGAPFV